MPYRLSDIAAKFNVHYYPIVSSARAFNALWKRAYSKAASLLGGVVYEDPWLAGGHNGLSNGEDPNKPEDPFPRVARVAQADARVRPGRHADHHGRRRLVAGGVGRLDRQSRARSDRVPVRHAPVADQGKPDRRQLEAAPADAEGGRRFPQPVQPDRLLLVGREQRLHPGAARTHRAAGRLHDRGGRRACRRIRRRPAQAHRVSHPRDLERVRGWEADGFTEAHAHAGQHADLRHAREGARDRRAIRWRAWAASASAAFRAGRSTNRTSATARSPTRAASASRRRCRRSGTRRTDPMPSRRT